MCGVPRLWESLVTGVYRSMKKTGGIKYAMFKFFISVGKKYFSSTFFYFSQWEKSTTTRSTSEGGVACVVIVRLFCCFRAQCVALLRRLYPNPRRDVTLWRLRKPHVMRRHIYDVSTRKQYDSNTDTNRAKCLCFCEIANAHFCKNELK